MTPDDLEAYARALAAQHGLDPDFVAAIGHAESGFKPDAVSKAGAMGPMQLMPATAKDLGVNPADPYDNVRGGVQYLAKLNDQFGGDPQLVAAAYNAGPGAVQKAGGVPNYPETKAYVAKVTAIDPSKVQWDSGGQIDASKVQWDKPKPAAANLGGTLQVGPWDTGLKIPPSVESALVGAGKEFTRLGQGVKQAFYGATNDSDSQAALANTVADENARYKPLADAHPVATAVGEGLPVVVGGPATMAAAGGLEYGTPQEKAIRSAAGYAGGKIGQYGGDLVGRVLQPVRGAGQSAINATQALFDKYGINGLPGQITGSRPVQWLESTLANLPGGGRIRDIVGAQHGKLNSVTMDAMGAGGDAVTPEAVQAAKRALGATFQSVPSQTVVQIDQGLAHDLMGVESNYYKNLSPDQRPIVKQYIDDILSHANTGGMPGDVYQAARSRIAARAASTQDSELKSALTGVYKSLDRAFDRSASPADAAAMKTVRSQYSAAKAIEPLANISGDVSPARLANAAKNLPPAAQDLAQLGLRMKGLPSSGTAERLFYQGLLSGGLGAAEGVRTGDLGDAAQVMAGSFAGPWLATQLLTRAPLRNYITKGVLNVSPQVEKLLERAGSVPGGLLGMSLSR